MKKFITIDGKKVYLDDKNVKEEKTEDEEIEDQVEKISNNIEAKLGLKELTEKIDKIGKVVDKKIVRRTSKILTLDKLMEKDIDKLDVREGLAVFLRSAMVGDRAKLKALSEGASADGGYLFPDEFRYELVRDIAEYNIMRNLVRVVPMHRDVMKIPSLESRPKVTWTEENAAKSTTTAHFGQETLTVKKMAAILYASDELIEDSQELDVVDLIIGLFAEAIAVEEERVIIRGNGTTQPTGLTTATIGSVACSGNLGFDDLINLEYLLPAKYSRGASYLVHRNNIREMRKLKDSQNRYLWMDAVAPGQPATFHGYPVREQNALGENEIYFGDYKQGYWLGDRNKMAVKISQDTETAFTKDQTAIRVVQRIAGNVILPEAIKKLTSIP